MGRRRIRQTAVAAALGLTQQAVSYKLNGLRPLTLDELSVIADLLGVSSADLLAEPAGAAVRSAS